jgi:endopeptidase La
MPPIQKNNIEHNISETPQNTSSHSSAKINDSYKINNKGNKHNNTDDTIEKDENDYLIIYCNNLKDKIIRFQKIIRKTILSVQRYKLLDIINATDLNINISNLEKIFTSLTGMLVLINNNSVFKLDIHSLTDKLQEINDELSSIFKAIGTENLDDLIYICLGNNYINKYIKTPNQLQKYDIFSQYLHPIGYKVFSWKHEKNLKQSKIKTIHVDIDKQNKILEKNSQNENENDTEKNTNTEKKYIQRNKIVEDFMIVEHAENLDCFDLARTSKVFQIKVSGVKLTLHYPEQKKTIIVSAIVDDLMLECLNYTYINNKINSLIEHKPTDSDFNTVWFDRFILSLTLKELIVYNNDELYNRYVGYINQINLLKQKTISNVVKEFISNDLYGQRSTIIQLLIKSNEPDYQYLAYLLYDLLSDDSNGNIDTQEQTKLFDSFPWNVKRYFKDAMKRTIQYTNNLSNFDNNKIPLEQQICLMKANDSVKEKAMIKLKEVKAKSEDSGSKARQYLDGLLKIPFNIYKEEPILKLVPSTRLIFKDLINKIQSTQLKIPINFPIKNNYSIMELKKYSTNINQSLSGGITINTINDIKSIIHTSNRGQLISYIIDINSINKKHKLKIKLCHSGKKSSYMREQINDYLNSLENNQDIILEFAKKLNLVKQDENDENITNTISKSIESINQNINQINDYMQNLSKSLDNSVYGHEKAKRQIERIIAQWINGEQSGYCFGFEGPPGVGKTSLAKKGIAECLIDNTNNPRPFSFIAIGGSSNGSTLEGHNYTYVGSTWGKIVDILMDKKCMNPIIFIDELDKVSRTEHGKEIIGILTHLIDTTQNDSFQDKYFNGIDLDISKALFIFSYNDVEAIDKILLDRIHRVKFDHLTLDDKLIITKKYILPEIYSKMGIENIILLNDDVIEYIIDEYTCEPGVRKLKEILFEIIGEINLSILKENKDYELPINITFSDVKYVYLKNRHEIKNKKIHEASSVGIITGLWANALGRGGILPIQCYYFPCNTFLELKLTGMQGDVMKESMNVAKTLAWSLLEQSEMEELVKRFDKTKLQGIHVHCPEGAVPKDGPSAGTAITIVIYSLLSNKKIKNNVAITGEICLQGNVTIIGGLELKILGGIKAGVDTFIYPEENKKDFDDFYEKYKHKSFLENIHFHPVSHIKDVLQLVFE